MWIYEGKPYDPVGLDPKVTYGFVYLIENLEDGWWYVGKKLFWFKGIKRVKGRRHHIRVESDWKTYFGSNANLVSDVKKLGEDKFRRTILHLCASKSECSYLEAKEQINREALLSQRSYNDWMMLRVTRKHLKNLQHVS